MQVRVPGAVVRSQRVRSRGCEDLDSDRISPAPANYTRQLSERSSWSVDRSTSRLARVNVEPCSCIRFAIAPRYPSHHSSFRGSYLRVTLRWPLTCASCVCLNRTTVYSRRETASTSLIVIAILDPLEHTPSTVLSRLLDSRDKVHCRL